MTAPDAMRSEPSDWIVRWSHLVPPGGTVLDVACGSGRHMRWFHERGHAVTGIDRAPEALAAAALFGHTVKADIENGPWPFATTSGLLNRRFDAVIVTNYLWRPRLADVVASVALGGVLLYETFSAGHGSVGRPSRPDFLLQTGELLKVCAGLRIVAFEEGWLDAPGRFVQRIAAVCPREAGSATPARYALYNPALESIIGPDKARSASQ